MSQLTYQVVADLGFLHIYPASSSTVTVNWTVLGRSDWTFEPALVTDTAKVTIQGETVSAPGVIPVPTTYLSPVFLLGNGSITGAQVSLTPTTPSLALEQSQTTDSAESSTTGTRSDSDTASSASIADSTSTSSTETTVSTTSPSNETTRTSNGSKIATGELAGVAIGCLIAGLLIASLLAFLFMRRREQSRRHRHVSKRDVASSDANEKSLKLTTRSPTNWQRHLPQPESDQTISRLVNRTLDNIELFVENYYADRPTTQMDGVVALDVSSFDSPYLDRPLNDVIHSFNNPTVLFKHCIAYYLLQKIDPTRNNSSSLLPREFVVPPKGEPKVLSQQRVLTAHSRSNVDQDEKYLAQRDRAAQTIVQQVERAFQPWARGTAEERSKNLKGILTHLSELGNKLFSQPATFEWRWSENRTSSQGRILVLPGLDKTTNSQAVSLTTPICLVEPRQLGPGGNEAKPRLVASGGGSGGM